MKVISDTFKNTIKELGRELDSVITYELDGETIELGNDNLNSITPYYEGGILKSVMKVLEIDSNIEIPLETELNYRFGVKVKDDVVQDYRDNYEYIDFGNYIVFKSEKQEDTNSYKITCYDKMLYSMKEYESLNITYPITIRSYIKAIADYMNIDFANENDTFANYDKVIPNELYLTSENKTLGYTFRDVLDELAEVTASTICINDNNELEIRYINDTKLNVNLFNVSSIEQKTENGITCTYDFNNETITFNGTCTAQTYFEFQDSYRVTRKNSQWLPKLTAYYVKGSATGFCNLQSGSEYFDLKDLNEENPLITLTHRTGGAKYTSVVFNQGDVVNNFTLRILVADEVYENYPLRETINEEYLKDINVNFGKIYGPVNTIVLSRSAGTDNIYYPSTLPENPIEIKISDNQIMNSNNRDEFLSDIYNKLNGLTYSINDFSSTGICYLELCDKYNVQIGENTYTCIMFNDDIEITQGLKEYINTDIQKESVTDYTKADTTYRKINQTQLIVDKQQGIIESIVNNTTYVSDTKVGTGEIQLENAYSGILYKLSIKGNLSLLFPQTEIKKGYPLTPSNSLTPSNTLTPSSPVPYGNNVLYPSNNLYPKNFNLLIDDKEYILDIDFLNYIDDTHCDEFIYNNGNCYIIRRVGIDSQGNMYALDNEIIEPRKGVILEVKSNSIIKLASFGLAILSATYLLQNTFTDNFATEAYVESSITQTANNITEQVNAKVGDDEIIAKLNLGIENGQGIVNFTSNQFTVESDNLQISSEGDITAHSAKFEDILIRGGEIYIPINIKYDYTQADVQRVLDINVGLITPTQEDYDKLDVNKDGIIDLLDSVLIRRMIINNIGYSNPAKILFKADGIMSKISLVNGNNKDIVIFSFRGVEVHDQDENYTLIQPGSITIHDSNNNTKRITPTN